MAIIGTRKNTIIYRTRKALWMMRLRRAGVIGGAALFVGWVGVWLHLSGSFGRAGDWVDNKIMTTTANMGFEVENVMVEGRQYSDAEILRAIINIEKGDPLFSFDPVEAKAQIERVDWIKSARVERRLPDTIYIELHERTPLALWQKDKQLSLIDEDGKIITSEGLRRFKDLIVVMGDEAPANAGALLRDLSAEPALVERTEIARWVDGRRWDLTMKNDITVKLPETDVGMALRRVAAAQEEDRLLDKDILNIDLREPGRIVVSTRPGAVQEYKAGLKTGNDI